MRIFVAVFPPPEVRQNLIEAARDLPTEAFRLTDPERVHLTLKFLGEVPPESVPDIASALEPATNLGAAFDAATAGFGAFPSARRARILWAGIGEGAEELRALARAVDDLLEPIGLAREDRSFVPHLTLGRARRPVSLDLTGTGQPERRFAVRKLELVESRQAGSGVTYESLAEYRL